EVPVPKAMTGTPFLAQIRTTSWMSAVSCAITTASGGCGASHVVVWACCSRTACEGISRLPNRPASASTALFRAGGSGRFNVVGAVVATSEFLPALGDGGKGYIRGQEPDCAIRNTHDDCDRRQGRQAADRPVCVFRDADRAAVDRL